MPISTRGKAAAAAAPAVSATAETATDDAAPESSSNRPPRGGRGAASGGKHQVESATGSQRAKNVEKIPALEGKSPPRKRAHPDSGGDVETVEREPPSSRRPTRRPRLLDDYVNPDDENAGGEMGLVEETVAEHDYEYHEVGHQHPPPATRFLPPAPSGHRASATSSPRRGAPSSASTGGRGVQQTFEEDEEEEEGEGDGPPKLVAEQGPSPDEIMMTEMIERHQMGEGDEYEGQVIRVQSPGGTQQYIQLAPGQDLEGLPEGTIFIEEAGDGAMLEEGGLNAMPADLRTVEFNFLDNKNICCGLCGEIVPYDLLMSEHLPQMHPEVLGDGADMHMEEIPYEDWLREKLRAEKRAIESGFKLTSYESPARIQHHRPLTTRVHRRVSQIRVNPLEMSLVQLDQALKRKMIEKMGRKVPVTLVDKQHARCGLCNAVVSLNKKFEVVHLVRHFNAWHPSAHRCAGTWNKSTTAPNCNMRPGAKPLSQQDFAVIDASINTPDNLQCIWCGMFMDTDSLAMHFDEVHPDDIEVPKCNLCLQELVINARMQEKFGDDFEVTLPDEHHLRCGKFSATFNSEAALERGIERRVKRGEGNAGGDGDDRDDADRDADDAGPEAFLNSRMSLGRRKKPKRQFIMPALRQAAPIDSQYVEPVNECQWKCKLCDTDILAAVISAGAIRHYRAVHPEHLDAMQYELCKARLERVSDGCMEFVHPQLIECLMCNMTYNLHRPYNMCRAIRHLKAKHPNLMPEYAGVSTVPHHGNKTIQVPKLWKKKRGAAAAAQGGEEHQAGATKTRRQLPTMQPLNEAVTDQATLEMLRAQFGVNIDKVQAVRGSDGEQVYVLMPEGEEMDEATAEQLAAALASGDIGEEEGAEGGEDEEEEEDPLEGDDMLEDDGEEDEEEDEEDNAAVRAAVNRQQPTESTSIGTRRSMRLRHETPRSGGGNKNDDGSAPAGGDANAMPAELLV